MVTPCERPGCGAYAVGGGTLCVVHLHPEGAKLCESCRGSGWFLPNLPCPRCGGVGLSDYTRHGSQKGSNRRREKVDERSLIVQSEVL